MCDEIKELISLFIDDELNAEKKSEVETHIENCEECREYYEQLKAIIVCLNDLPQLELPENFHMETMKKIKAETPVKKNIFDFSMRKIKKVRDEIPVGKNIFLISAKYASVAAGLLFVVTLVSVIGSGISGFSEERLQGNDTARIMESTNYSTGGSGESSLAYESSSSEAIMSSPTVRSFSQAQINNDSMESVVENRALADMQEEVTVKTYNITLDVEKFDFAIEAIAGLNGSTLNSNLFTNYAGDRSAYYEIRFPEEAYNHAISALSSLGKVTEESGSIQILKYDYQDTAVRLAAKEAERQRLLELFEKTNSMANMLMLERRLIEVENETDMYKASIASYTSQSANPIIYIRINERMPEVITFKEEAFLSRVRNSFVLSVNGTAALVERLLVFSAGGIIPVTVTGIFAMTIFLSVRKAKIRRRSGDR